MKRFFLPVSIGLFTAVILLLIANKAIHHTSTNEYCASCHIHPHSTTSWKLSTHYNNKSGIVVNCVDCHLPPQGEGYLVKKTTTGLRDVWSKWTKDSAEFKWEARSSIHAASEHTFQTSCMKCHQNLFPLTLSKDGQAAHLYFDQNKNDVKCTNCHLQVGHYKEGASHSANVSFGEDEEAEILEKYETATEITSFENFTEQIPGTVISFNMIAIPAGEFLIGSPADEFGRKEDEGPQKKVKTSQFFMGEIEVTWDEYLAFYKDTYKDGRTTDQQKTVDGVDAITGPTPPYGSPDQGWGIGNMPAITMRYHAAETYCKWLSAKTGKTYRLPTEAEWEYAYRANTTTPYFFDSSPKVLQNKKNKGKYTEDFANAKKYVVFEKNSQSRSTLPKTIEANPFGLKHMGGNIAEFCSDFYSADAYSKLTDGVTDPKGPASGESRVVRGGYFDSDALNIRAASRSKSQPVSWMQTDPQIPKSIWWYSDCNYIGFRVVCESK